MLARMDGKRIPLFGSALADRASAARDLGILSPPEIDPPQSRLVIYLSRIDGEWRGTVQTADRELEKFVGEDWHDLMQKMIACGTVLAAGVAPDETWAEILKVNEAMGGDQ
jgi:hypothetical protein